MIQITPQMRIQSLKQERAQAGCERTGFFTTSIICQVEDRSIALYHRYPNEGMMIGCVSPHGSLAQRIAP